MRKFLNKNINKSSKPLNLCCDKLSYAFQCIDPTFRFISKDLILLFVGDHCKPAKVMDNLVKAMGIDTSNIKPKIPPNELIKVPVMWPIQFCPFCGKQIKKKRHGNKK